MKLKMTLALTLALGTSAVTGAAQEAPKSGNSHQIETVSHSGILARGFSWLPGSEFGKNLFSKHDGEAAKSMAEVRRPSLLKRISLYFRNGTQPTNGEAQRAEVRRVSTAKPKKHRPGKTGQVIDEARFGYVFARDLDEMRSSVFGSRITKKSDRHVARADERRARLPQPKHAREMQAWRLSPDEENHLKQRLAHGDVDRFRGNAVTARIGPDRGQTSWIGKTLARFSIQTPVTSDRKYGKIVERYAQAYGVPVELAHAVIKVESNYRPDVRGRAGEVGLMQIKPATARLMGYSGSTKELFDPENNIKYGMLYLAKAHKLGGGSTCGTILKYNAGHGARRMNPVSARYCAKVKKQLEGA